MESGELQLVPERVLEEERIASPSLNNDGSEASINLTEGNNGPSYLVLSLLSLLSLMSFSLSPSLTLMPSLTLSFTLLTHTLTHTDRLTQSQVPSPSPTFLPHGKSLAADDHKYASSHRSPHAPLPKKENSLRGERLCNWYP